MAKNPIGGRVREARMRSNPIIRQKDLIARMGILGIPLDDTAISKIEAGTRAVSCYELVAIAKSLKVTTDWLLDCENLGDDENVLW